MLSLILLAVLAQPDAAGPVPPTPARAGLAPEHGVAVLDGKGALRVTRIERGWGAPSTQVVWFEETGTKKGEKVPGKVRVKVTRLQLTEMELPARLVKAYTVDGKAVPAARLAELLARERPVLIASNGRKVDPFHLQLYKEGTLVLVLPARVGSGVFDPNPPAAPDGFSAPGPDPTKKGPD
jgi:hypothetical protein